MPFDLQTHETVSVKVPEEAMRSSGSTIVTRVEVSLPSKANVVVKASARDRDLLVVKKDDPGFGHLRTWLLLRLLGLSGREPVQMHASRNALVRRMLDKTSTYVEVTALALPAQPNAADTMRSGGIDMTEARYEIKSGEGIQFDLADGERLNVEPREGYYSIAWTTALPLVTLIPRLQEFLQSDPSGELTIFVGDEYRTSSDVSSRKLLEGILVSPAVPTFWRLDAEGLTLTWEARDEAEVPGQPGLLGLIADEFNGTDIRELLEATATPLIGAEAPLIVSRCAEAAKRRHLLATG